MRPASYGPRSRGKSGARPARATPAEEVARPPKAAPRPRPGAVDPAVSRAALVAAARRLLDRAQPLTMAAAAAEAGLSRATVYRHFPDPKALLAAASRDPEADPVADMLAGLRHPRDRALAAQAFLLRQAREDERRRRPHLARSQDLWSAGEAERRSLRRLAVFRAALAPARQRMEAQDFDDLVQGLCLCGGIESHVALCDLCRLPGPDADRVARKAAEALLDRWLPPPWGQGPRRTSPPPEQRQA